MYEQFATFADQATTAFLDQGIAAGAAFTAQYMRGALMILVCLAAYLCWSRRLDVHWVARRVLIALVVIQLLQAGTYNTYIREPFWTTIPNAVASAFNGNGVSITAAQRFDRVRDAFSAQVEAASALLNPWNVRAHFGVAVADGLAKLFIAGCFGLWQVARVAIALLITVGPFLLIAAIFDATRGWVMGWLDKLIGLSVWYLAAVALSEMMLAGTMSWIQQVAQTGGSLPDRIDGLWAITAWVFINMIVMIGLPYYVAFRSGVAGGVNLGLGMAVSTTGAVAGIATRAGVAAGRAVMSRTRNARL